MATKSETGRKWSFIADGGEMSALIKAKDWSRHPLGEPEQWPDALRVLLSSLLTNRFPMFLWWGKDLFCFYNDAYRPSLGDEGRHPGILGAPAKEAWPDIWEVIGPMIQQVLAGGESVWSEDQLLPILRNGRMEEVYWTFSYSAARDSAGNISGVLVTCSETTGKVQAIQLLKENEQRLNTMVQQAPVAVAIITGPDHVVEMINDRGLALCDRTREEVIGLPVRDIVPELLAQGIPAYMEDVLHGASFEAKELPLSIVRNGHREDLYLNLVLEPLLSQKGETETMIAIGYEVTDMVLARQRAEAGEERFRLLADSMPQFVWTGDGEGKLNYFNQAVYDFSGLSDEEVQANGWLQIVHPDEREGNSKAWVSAITSGTDFFFEHRFRRKDGEYRWQMSRAKPLHNADGSIRMWIGTSTDVQDMKEQEAEKDFFIGMAGHELRNPLNTLRGCIDMMQHDMEQNTDAEFSQLTDIMDRQVVKLSRLIADLLDISKLKNDTLDMDQSRFDANELMQNVVEEMRSSYPDHVFNMSGTDHAPVQADRFRVGQVLGNLITNAVKYAPDEKEVEITCCTEEGHAKISVGDRGIGIRPEDQHQIFQRFFRVKGNRTNGIEGFGIGLYIAADIIKRHGGHLSVKSEEGKGSVFSFTLPLVEE